MNNCRNTIEIDVENSDVNINKHVDRSISQIAQFIVNHGLDPLNLPQTETKLWMVRNTFRDSIYKMK